MSNRPDFRQQMAQGFIIVSVLGAVLVLGTACSPVTSSVSKLPRSGHTKLRDTSLSGKSFVSVAETHLTGQENHLETVREVSEGLTEYSLTDEEMKNIRKRGSTLLRLEVAGSVEIHTVLEVALASEKIEEEKLRDVKASWLTVNPRVSEAPAAAEFVLSLTSETDSGRKTVMRHLKSVTVYYRTLN